ncbi:MAG: hypothetical protein ACRDOK_10095 [Streptosporangiaceae bacterium]
MKADSFIGTPTVDPARLEMETNYFGTLSMCRALAPVLAANGSLSSAPGPASPAMT